MSRLSTALFTIFLIFSLSDLKANQNIFVTSTRVDKVHENTSNAIDVYDRYDIEESGASSLKSFLSQVSELNLFSTGPGQVTSVQMRGNDNRHTLVIVDGIPLSDVTSPDGASRFESLGLFDIEKIEILYGAQSVLYGSQAIGGVIKITTQKESSGGRLQFGGGDYGRNSGKALFRGSVKDLRYKIFLSADKMFGPSSRKPTSGNVSDDDQTLRMDANLSLSYKNFTFNQRFQKLDYEFDASSSEELNDEGIYENLNQSLRYETKSLSAFISRSTFERNLSIRDSGSDSVFTYKGESIRSRVASTLERERFSLITGVEGRLDKGK